MSFVLLGHGAAVPQFHADDKEALQFALDRFARDEKDRRTLPILYRMAGVKRRHTVLLKAPEGRPAEERYSLLYDPAGPDDMGPSTSERMAVYEESAVSLAVEASRKALDASGVVGSDITHLVTISCSGFFAPGVDVALMNALVLPPTVARTHVGFMGCHGALNGLRVARGFGLSDPKAVVLVCAVEVCSIHYHYGFDPEKVVANALFADGSAATVGRAGDSGAGWPIRATGSCLLPDSEDAMTWRIRDNGFEMTLSPKVPARIEEHLRPWLEGWLTEHGLALEDIATWAVHPGGPRILSSVAKALDLPKGTLDPSHDVLKQFGNMSSPTILFIIERLRAAQAPLPCVALGFGPGLIAEAVLFAD